MNKNIGEIFVAGSAFALLDQLSKWAVVAYFGLPYSQNTGVAFSIHIPYAILLGLTIILLVAVFYFASKELNLSKNLSKISVALVLGGGLGNLIDRIVNGAVIDFISIWKYPTFNVADAFIVIGVLLIVVFYGKIKLIKTKK